MGEPARDSLAPDWIDAFRARADARGAMSFEAFMQLALYHPMLGYYRQDRPRVGYAPGSDFYTASTSAPIFGDLVVAAVCTLLGPRPPSDYCFVEVGAEPGRGILRNLSHPFGSSREISLGQPLAFDGPSIVFSNELFDAQPCRRFVKRARGWCEVFVRLDAIGRLEEEEMAGDTPSYLPEDAPADYRIDAPESAVRLAAEIASAPWPGLFVAFDYGKSWPQLSRNTPQGTARAYHRHTQCNDLIARPGRQDLTCHVCWDWLADALVDHGFAPPLLETQEAFLIKHAGARIETLMNATASTSNMTRRSLMQLLHPAYLGQKFEVLHAFRAPR